MTLPYMQSRAETNIPLGTCIF